MGERTFIGLELSAEARQALTAVRHAIVDSAQPWSDQKWVAEENLHVTVKFLGDLSDDPISDVCRTCDSVANALGSFALELDTVIPIPNSRAASMLWATVAKGSEDASLLAKRLDVALEDLGFNPETRVYRPHITLVRARKPRSISSETLAAGCGALGRADASDRVVSVRSVTVYSSTLTRQGPVYRAVHSAQLGA